MLSPVDGLLCLAAGFLLAAYLDCRVVRRWFRKYWDARRRAQVAEDELRVLEEEGRR